MPTDQGFLDSLAVQYIDDSTPGIGSFCCNDGVEWFLKNVACDHHRRRISTTTCWLSAGVVVGYISTSMSTVELFDAPQRGAVGLAGVVFQEHTKHARRFPAFLVGMLGVDKSSRRKGLAKHMVQYSIGKARSLSESVGCRFVTVDADKTPEASGLYQEMKFTMVEGQDARRATAWMYFDLGSRS